MSAPTCLPEVSATAECVLHPRESLAQFADLAGEFYGAVLATTVRAGRVVACVGFTDPANFAAFQAVRPVQK